MAVWRILCQELGYRSAVDFCAAVMGHSLGEFSALCVAGAVSFTDAVKLVVRAERATTARACISDIYPTEPN